MGAMDNIKCAIWARVSTDEQSTENQLAALRREAERRGYQVTRTFDLEQSAYNGSTKHEAALYRAKDGARTGDYSVLLVWALDRLTRQGSEATLRIYREFLELGCKVESLQEPWTAAPTECVPLLLAVTGWVARMESTRRSERTRAGNARWLAAHPGQKLGRRKGSKDRQPRKRSARLAS